MILSCLHTNLTVFPNAAKNQIFVSLFCVCFLHNLIPWLLNFFVRRTTTAPLFHCWGQKLTWKTILPREVARNLRELFKAFLIMRRDWTNLRALTRIITNTPYPMTPQHSLLCPPLFPEPQAATSCIAVAVGPSGLTEVVSEPQVYGGNMWGSVLF